MKTPIIFDRRQETADKLENGYCGGMIGAFIKIVDIEPDLVHSRA
jgi:hypothetical protein